MVLFRQMRPTMRSESRPDVAVEIYPAAWERILANVSASGTEEGGKFLGSITRESGRIHVRVCSYLDAGPNVRNSWSHLFPDGEHQEHLFRLVEGFDPSIEHIGSWHSHHCNALKQLSSGDIEGYAETVNARSYNLDWFFVMLVTDVRARQMDVLYYLFHRGDRVYYSIPASQVRRPQVEYRWENILREVEAATLSFRRLGAEDLAPETGMRAADHGWLKQTYPNVRVVRSRGDGSLSWRWTVPARRAEMEITYRHLLPARGNSRQAALSIRHDNREILSDEIELDPSRYQKILNLIEKTRALIEKP